MTALFDRVMTQSFRRLSVARFASFGMFVISLLALVNADGWAAVGWFAAYVASAQLHWMLVEAAAVSEWLRRWPRGPQTIVVHWEATNGKITRLKAVRFERDVDAA